MRIVLFRIMLLVPFAFPSITIAQTRRTPVVKEVDGSKKEAKDNFSIGNYKDAIPEYKALLKKDSTNIDYNYKLGICYLESNVDKTLALPLLEIVVISEKKPIESIFYMGKAYAHAHQFDDAIKYYELYKKEVPDKPELIADADNEISACLVAKKLISRPLVVGFHNLGKSINTTNPEYNAYIPFDESSLVYTTRSKKNMGSLTDFDEEFPSDVFYSTYKYGKWRRGRSIGSSVNTELNDRCSWNVCGWTASFRFYRQL